VELIGIKPTASDGHGWPNAAGAWMRRSGLNARNGIPEPKWEKARVRDPGLRIFWWS
jgi:hypothetical protein